MHEVTLYTRSGGIVATVFVPELHPPVDVVHWGNRCFVRREKDGHYFEGLAYTLWVDAKGDPMPCRPAGAVL